MKCVIALLCMLITMQCCWCKPRHAGHPCFNYAVFPAHVQELRTSYHKIKTYFQNKDDNFKISLLRSRDLPVFKDNHSCQFLKEMLNFYLTDVIPAAKTHSRVINVSVSKIGNALHELHANVLKCHLFFSCDRCICNQSPHFRNIQRTFKQLQVKGVYKAMSELNTFIDWIWNYINMKRNSS
ncbi:interleukin-10-like [Leucoraja erinacea]|uniref:interleukin-10-like n=1 Tax=Leucoraja erinaceus TaxID=7782 RepID=UPI0024584324|nr:interleukin-10-like [Leucoraja erinacea]